jgi:hypothetical protein
VLIVLSTESFLNEPERLIGCAPRECDALDLPGRTIAPCLFYNGVLLGAVSTGRVVEKPVVSQFEAIAAAPGVLGQLNGQFLG